MSTRLGIGIDTGGTFTDACLFNFDTQEVIRCAKARTTYHDLAIGINAAVAALGNDAFSSVEMISLSSTLATNAMVEGRGGRECLLLLGYDHELMKRLSPGVGLELHDRVFFIRGGIDIHGKETEPVDLAAAREAILSVQHSVDAIGISGYLSVLNPTHELAVRQLAQELTDLPVTCGHELTGELQSVKRAATVALNARLIPTIHQLIESVQNALTKQGLQAPLLVVQGDGSLVRAEVARMQPVQTILSGPAASCTGGALLSGHANCIAVDMGGTTSDIALLQNGAPELDPNGASVGKWQTSIGAVRVRTIGLGGDSHICVTQSNEIEIGPQRVIPLCVAASEHPAIKSEINRLAGSEHGLSLVQPFDFLCVLRPETNIKLASHEAAIINALGTGPLSLYQLAENLGAAHPLLLDTHRLERLGIIGRIGLTPTDIMHATGIYSAYDAEASINAIAAVADILMTTVDELIKHINGQISKKLALEILSQLLSTGEKKHFDLPGCGACEQLLGLGFGTTMPEAKGGLSCGFSLGYPLVALGAPGDVFLRQAARLLGGELLLPKHSEVANAVGAITGNVIRVATCAVIPLYDTVGITGYTITGITGNHNYEQLEQALEVAKRQVKLSAEALAREAGATDVNTKLDTEVVGKKVHLETKVTATAIGRPAMLSNPITQ